MNRYIKLVNIDILTKNSIIAENLLKNCANENLDNINVDENLIDFNVNVSFLKKFDL